jgi:hypothetical protein
MIAAQAATARKREERGVRERAVSTQMYPVYSMYQKTGLHLGSDMP